ncbi:sugar efflux transporter [Clostridium paridis]|uniref:Sugar efflux transporter n=1 Tax=Clostridium paridis TaxID=2803863 RepID=A0A937K494_9CLOT|nr:sugar efflux transporter [Clostridium paridis]MBL4930945.1 sugar efflux transporter [Clostridium paridis]
MFKKSKNLFGIQGYMLLTICMLLMGVGVSVTMPYLSLYCTEELGMSAGSFGVFMAFSSISGVIVNSFIAKRSDSGMDRKRVIILAMLSSALGYTSFLIFHNFFILIITVTLFNGLGAASMPQIFAYAQESANESKSDNKTFAMSALRSLFSLGFLIGPLVGALIFSGIGYKGLFLGTIFVFIIISVIVLLFLKNRKASQNNNSRGDNTESSLLKNKKIMKPFIALTILFGLNAINGINTPLFIVNSLHGSIENVGLVASISAGLEIPIMLALGAIAKKISNHKLMIYSCFVSLAYYGVLSISTQPWQIIAAQILQATTVAVVFGNGLGYFAELLPHSPGLSATMYSNGSTIGRLIGTLGGGMVAQFAGYRNVNLVCLGVVVISLIILLRTEVNIEVEAPVGQDI